VRVSCGRRRHLDEERGLYLEAGGDGNLFGSALGGVAGETGLGSTTSRSTVVGSSTSMDSPS